MFKKLSYSLPCYLIYQKRNKPSLFFRVTVSEREITAKQNKKQKNPQAFIHIDLIGQRKIKKKKKSMDRLSVGGSHSQLTVTHRGIL